MKTTEQKIIEVLYESAELAAEKLLTPWVKKQTGSEIERLMLYALWSRLAWKGDGEIDGGLSGLDYGALDCRVMDEVAKDAGFMFKTILIQQMAVGNCRADFGLASATSPHRRLIVAVECDGHDFHNATKSQVARDKARDRAFAERDIRLFRFSGYEIWRDAGACADQVIGFIKEWQTVPLLQNHEIVDGKRTKLSPIDVKWGDA